MFVKTLNITDSVSNIATSAAYKYYWIRNLGAEDASVFKASADADTNKKIILSQDEYVKIIPENNNIYFKSSSTGTKIEVYGTNTDICPFKIGKVKGSDGGGVRTETVLWENEGTTNPETITLSEAYTNFDEIILYDGGGYYGIASNIYVQSVLRQGNGIGIIEDTERRIWYRITSPTTLRKDDEDTYKNITLHSIIGIKY